MIACSRCTGPVTIQHEDDCDIIACANCGDVEISIDSWRWAL